MKRTLFLTLVVCAVAALGGWGLAQVRIAQRKREAAQQAETARRAAEIAAKKPAEPFAGLVRETDEVVISFHAAQGKNEVRFRDSAWLAQLAGIVRSASYKPTAHLFPISTPNLTLYRKGEEVLYLMPFGAGLRVYGRQQKGGDFIVGEETTRAILALVRQKQPDA